MRLVYDNRQRQFVNSLDSGQALSNPAFGFTRRDSAALEFQNFTTANGIPTVEQIAAVFDLRFAALTTDDWGGDPIVLHTAFSWLPMEGVYRGFPSFDTDELTAMFVEAAGVTRYTAAHTCITANLGRLLSIGSETAVNITVPAGLGGEDNAIYILSRAAAVTVVAGAGVTITPDTGISLTVDGPRVLKLTRLATANTWRASKPAEKNEVELMGELTWRDMSEPLKWTSTPKFKVIIANDVIRGNEAAPVNPGAITDYVTRAELGTGFVLTDATQSLSDEQKSRARTNIGAISGGDLVQTTVQSLSDGQKTQARTNIGAASQAALDTANAAATALALTVVGKASSASVTALGATLTALDSVVLKKTVQAFSDAEKAVILTNIGALPAGTQRAYTRLAASFNPIGNSTTVHLNGAIATNVGTATARSVTVLDAGHTISTFSGTTITSTAHGGVDGQASQFTASLFPSGLATLQWYYLRDVTTNTFAVASTPGGAAIALSGSATSLKVLLAVAPYYHLRRIGYVSAASAGASCGTRHSALQWAVSDDPNFGLWTFQARFGISDAAAVANARMFVGLTAVAAGGVLPNANPSAQLNIIGVGADTGDSTLRIIHNDNAGTATRIDLGADFPCSTRNTHAYELLLTCNPDLTVTYQVTNLTTGDVATANLSTDLPMKLQLLAPQLWRNNGGTTLAVGLDVIQWKMESAQ